MTNTTSEGINVLREIIEASCKRLGSALQALDYPNGGVNGIFHESNLVAYLSHGFLSHSEDFHCYAEAYFRSTSEPSSRSGRVDLVASDGKLAFVIEAKKFGDLGASKGACNDVKRMGKFIPRFSPAVVPRDGNWWTNSRERWGVIAIACQRPSVDCVHKAWLANREDEARTAIWERKPGGESQEKIEERNEAFLDLWKCLNEKERITIASSFICSGKHWKQSNDAWLLWAAFPLKQDP